MAVVMMCGLGVLTACRALTISLGDVLGMVWKRGGRGGWGSWNGFFMLVSAAEEDAAEFDAVAVCQGTDKKSYYLVT